MIVIGWCNIKALSSAIIIARISKDGILFEGGECNSSPIYTAADRRRKTVTNRKSIKNGYSDYVATALYAIIVVAMAMLVMWLDAQDIVWFVILALGFFH